MDLRSLIGDRVDELSEEERRVMTYFVTNVSVGELIVLRELRARYKIPEPLKVLRSLVEKGLLERGEGCYNLAEQLREKIFASRHSRYTR